MSVIAQRLVARAHLAPRGVVRMLVTNTNTNTNTSASAGASSISKDSPHENVFKAGSTAGVDVPPLVRYLTERNLLEKSSLPAAPTAKFLDPRTNRKGGVYCGFDPSSSSLHLGNLLPIMSLVAFYAHGFDVYFLVGGGTGSLGDPTGKAKERAVIPEDEFESNRVQIHTFLKGLTGNVAEYVKEHGFSNANPQRMHVVDNKDWLGSVDTLSFFKVVGRLLRAGPLIDREYVQARIRAGVGISFAEFSYQAFQAYDFFHLFTSKGVNIQIGGADQWGNLSSGANLILRAVNSGLVKEYNHVIPQETAGEGENQVATPPPSIVLTTPLLVDEKGEKIGKSTADKKRIWLSTTKMSSLKFYQSCKRLSDHDAGVYLKSYTCIPIPEVNDILERHAASPKEGILQNVLASEMTWLVHGKAQRDLCILQNKALQELESKGSLAKNPQGFTETLLETYTTFTDSQHVYRIPRDGVFDKKFVDVLIEAKNSMGEGIAQNKKAAHALLKANTVKVNGTTVSGQNFKTLKEKDFIDSKIAFVKLNKETSVFIELI